LKAITLTQPWASLTPIRAKKIETRSWGTSYRGPLAIHAAKGPGEYSVADLEAILREKAFADALRREDGTCPTWQDLPHGSIVSVCHLADCLPMRWGPGFSSEGRPAFDISFEGPLTEEERAFGCYDTDRFAWILEDIVPVDPVLVRGMQGLWDVPREIGFTQAGQPVIGCCSCGRLLPIAAAFELDRPISPGNPYPDSYYACSRQQCQDDIQQWIESEYRSIQEQINEMVANGDLDKDNMYR